MAKNAHGVTEWKTDVSSDNQKQISPEAEVHFILFLYTRKHNEVKR